MYKKLFQILKPEQIPSFVSKGVVLEAVNSGIFEEGSIFERIPCVMSQDGQRMFVFIESTDPARFTKSILLNLMTLAKKISPECHDLVLIVSRRGETPADDAIISSQYEVYKKTMRVIDGERLTKSALKSIVSEDNWMASLEGYGFFSCKI